MKTSKKASKKNVVRLAAKKTAPKPKAARSDAFASKLDMTKAESIRTRVAKGEKPSRVAKELGCSFGAVRAILEYRSYCPAGVVPVVAPLSSADFARLEALAKKTSSSLQDVALKILRAALGSKAA